MDFDTLVAHFRMNRHIIILLLLKYCKDFVKGESSGSPRQLMTLVTEAGAEREGASTTTRVEGRYGSWCALDTLASYHPQISGARDELWRLAPKADLWRTLGLAERLNLFCSGSHPPAPPYPPTTARRLTPDPTHPPPRIWGRSPLLLVMLLRTCLYSALRSVSQV